MATMHRVVLDLTLLGGVPRGCPQCGDTRDLVTLVDGEDTAFRCTVCGSCWHRELGYATRNDPQVCTACPSQPDCLAHAAGSVGASEG